MRTQDDPHAVVDDVREDSEELALAIVHGRALLPEVQLTPPQVRARGTQRAQSSRMGPFLHA